MDMKVSRQEEICTYGVVGDGMSKMKKVKSELMRSSLQKVSAHIELSN